jgi:hypothetical protein
VMTYFVLWKNKSVTWLKMRKVIAYHSLSIGVWPMGTLFGSIFDIPEELLE